MRDATGSTRPVYMSRNHHVARSWSPICARPPATAGRVRGVADNNEEMQSSTEELETTTRRIRPRKVQTTRGIAAPNEELETTNEEKLQSTNAEIRRNNRELAHKHAERKADVLSAHHHPKLCRRSCPRRCGA